MPDARFEKVQRSNEAMYGPRKFVLCGFGHDAQPKFKTVLELAGLADVPLVWAAAEDATLMTGALFARPDGAGLGIGSALPRAIIMAGITENELHRLLNVSRKAGMRQALWAALTPTSETWPLKDLLAELSAERRELKLKRS